MQEKEIEEYAKRFSPQITYSSGVNEKEETEEDKVLRRVKEKFGYEGVEEGYIFLGKKTIVCNSNKVFFKKEKDSVTLIVAEYIKDKYELDVSILNSSPFRLADVVVHQKYLDVSKQQVNNNRVDFKFTLKTDKEGIYKKIVGVHLTDRFKNKDEVKLKIIYNYE